MLPAPVPQPGPPMAPGGSVAPAGPPQLGPGLAGVPGQSGMPMGAAPASLPPPPPQPPVTIDAVMGLLRDGALRRFRIDIEADSTIVGDESQERNDRMALIDSAMKLLGASGPLVQAQPILAPLVGEFLQFGVRGFRVGRSLEDIIDETVDKLDAFYGQPKPPPQPSPDEMVKLQGTQAKTQAEIQKAQLAVQAAQQDHQAKAGQLALEQQAAERQAQRDFAEHQMKLQAMQAEMVQRQQEMRAAEIAHAHKLELMHTQHEHAMRQAKQQPKGDRR